MTWPPGDPSHPYGTPPPPPLPYQQSPYGRPNPYGPPKKSRRGLIIVLSVLGGVVLIAIVAAGLIVWKLEDTAGAADVQVGNCIADVPTSARITRLPTVDCSRPHGGEVFAVLTLPDGAYPAPSVLNEWQKKCPPALAAYSPAAKVDRSIGVFVLYPTQQTWDAGDRAVTCIATLSPKRTGTLRG